jgi:hypothetical protein
MLRSRGRRAISGPHVNLWAECSSGERQPGTYIPLVDVRTILTGFASRISRTSRFPETAAARAKALRDKDDDFASRIPARRE